MVDSGGEVDLRWLEWVVCWEVDGEEEDTTRVWRVTLLCCISKVAMIFVECRSQKQDSGEGRSNVQVP